MVILVCGGRDYSDASSVRRVLGEFTDHSPMVIHGDYSGADTLAKMVALEFGFKVVPYPADWATYGPAAGPIRNQEMVDTQPDLVVAFRGGRGTYDCVKRAERAGIPVRHEA